MARIKLNRSKSLPYVFFVLMTGFSILFVTRGYKESHDVGRQLMSEEGGGCHAELFPYRYHDGVGWFILHCLCILYMFVGLAVVCDEYFVASLERICEKLKLGPDVAGATFMAAGSSAPELFTSIASMFSPGNPTGIGTIIGSAIFNITVIIGLSILLAGQSLKVDWRPLTRDIITYAVVILVLLLLFITGNKAVDWYEAMILLLLYVGYVLFMSKNETIMGKCGPKNAENTTDDKLDFDAIDGAEQPDERPQPKFSNNPAQLATVRMQMMAVATGRMEDPVEEREDDEEKGGKEEMKEKEEVEVKKEEEKKEEETKEEGGDGEKKEPAAVAAMSAFGKHKMNLKDVGRRVQLQVRTAKAFKSIIETPIENIPSFGEGDGPKTLSAKIWFYYTFPLSWLLAHTIPDCRKEKYENRFMWTFFLSILWIGVFSHFMVGWAAYVGCFVNIPAVMMGLTVLAAGTSVPDAMSSVMVAREGLADMAVANSLGSNIFDILIGLGLPWFITALISGAPVSLNATGIGAYIGLAFGVLGVFVVSVVVQKFDIQRNVGFIMLALYVIYVVFGILSAFPCPTNAIINLSGGVTPC